ncbi:glycosyltransferase family 2 protein [Polaribacter pectinis]|uniref:Glycosyltransferase family 2 protein n=1 Tax=Polaribacter pectinis TaxID=2738844 RepID=A0A7G9LCA4_9FLAO|nr:glycosyltransferase family 2 protein [Polaribacter pectinis]QNM86253.1 glycosyltransferase family 2 protein [Polaribacter pectinis]
MDTNLNIPLVSVLMPVYNSEDYVGEAIESVLKQTYDNFEFLIVNDFSTDKSLDIILSYKDSRIKVLNMKQNSGISETLNFGLLKAKGKYIVRMDSDDISLPNRIKKQVEFLEKNKEHVICGSNYSIINSSNKVVLPEKHSIIKTGFLHSCCVAHPTVVIRKSILEKNKLFYSKDNEPAEDYHLWSLLIHKGKFYNIQENLLAYRVHQNQISQSKKTAQDKKSFSVKINYIKTFYKELTKEETLMLEKLLLYKKKMQDVDIKIFSDFVFNLKISNSKTNFFESKSFQNYISTLENTFLTNYFSKYERYSYADFLKYLKVVRKYKIKFNLKNSLNLFIKSAFFYKIKTDFL